MRINVCSRCLKVQDQPAAAKRSGFDTENIAGHCFGNADAIHTSR